MSAKVWVERRTGILFGTYRPTEPRDPTWLVIAPASKDVAFSVVIGNRGFYVARVPDPAPERRTEAQRTEGK